MPAIATPSTALATAKNRAIDALRRGARFERTHDAVGDDVRAHPWRSAPAAGGRKAAGEAPLQALDAKALAWLARPEEALPKVQSPGALVLADVGGFVVVPVPPGLTLAALLQLALRRPDDGALPFCWDGQRLYEVGQVRGGVVAG